MGYETAFSLDIADEGDKDFNEMISEFRNVSKKIADAIDEDGYCNNDTSDWSDYDDRLKEFSKKYPDAVFILNGDGEEEDDEWFTYYKNGKLQHCPKRIEYDEYDENKLQ